MLVLSRKLNESVIINQNIEVTVLGVEGDVVKIGINAPKNVEIHRKEVYLQIKQANTEAANSKVSLNDLTKLLKKT